MRDLEEELPSGETKATRLIQTHLELICEVHARFAVVNNGYLKRKNRWAQVAKQDRAKQYQFNLNLFSPDISQI